MEAANRGAYDVGGPSIGLNIVLPYEQRPNPYITPELSFQFHYFAIRKMHFLLRAQALVAFPGGFGTLDELFETLTLIQTRKMKPVPILLFGEAYWRQIIRFDLLVEDGTIDPADLTLFQYVETAEQAWAIIKAAYHTRSTSRMARRLWTSSGAASTSAAVMACSIHPGVRAGRMPSGRQRLLSRRR
jgi:hypothetical protein